jgi:hypothetical protein
MSAMLLAGLTDAISAFEQGSGLSVRSLGGAASIFGMLVIAVGCAWGLSEQIRAAAHDDITQPTLFGRALIAAAVMIFCLTLFAAGTVLSGS